MSDPSCISSPSAVRLKVRWNASVTFAESSCIKIGFGPRFELGYMIDIFQASYVTTESGIQRFLAKRGRNERAIEILCNALLIK
jgi:hypothetical protein